jgi:hypothetical protein
MERWNSEITRLIGTLDQKKGKAPRLVGYLIDSCGGYLIGTCTTVSNHPLISIGILVHVLSVYLPGVCSGHVMNGPEQLI